MIDAAVDRARPSSEITDIRMKVIHDSRYAADHGRFSDDDFILFNRSPAEIREAFDIGSFCLPRLNQYHTYLSTSLIHV